MADKEVRVRITGDVSDILKKLEQLEDVFNNLGDDRINSKGINNLIDDIDRVQKKAEEMGESFDDIADTSRKFDNTGISDMTKDLSNAYEGIDKTTNAMKELNNQTKELATNQAMDDYYKSLEGIGDITKDLQKNLDSLKDIDISTKSGSDNDKGFMSNYIDAVVTGEVAGRRMADSFESVKSSIDSMTDSLKNITDGLDLEKVVKSFNELPKNIDKSTKNLEELREEADRLRVLAGEVEDFDFDLNPGEFTERAKQAQKELEIVEELIAQQEKLLKAQKDTEGQSLNKLKNYSKYYEQLSAKVKDFIDDESNGILVREKVAKSFKEVTKAMEDMYKINSDGSPNKSLKKMQEDYDALGKTIKDLTKQLKELEEKDKTMSDFFNAFDFDELHELESLREGLKNLVKERKDYVKSLEDIEKANKDQINSIYDLANARAELESKKADIDYEDFKEASKVFKTLEEDLDRIKKAYGETFEGIPTSLPKLLEYAKHLQDFVEDFKDIEQQLKDCDEGIEDFTKQIWDGINGLDGYSDSTKNVKEAITEVENKIKDYIERIKELEQAQKNAREAEEYFMDGGSEELIDVQSELERTREAYLKLGKEIVELRDKSKQVNENFDKVSKSNLDDKINNLTNEAKEFTKSLNLIDFDTLREGLNKLGTDIEDKREKLIRFREINKELDESSRKAVNSLDKQGKSIKDFADKAGFAVEIFEELIDNAKRIGADGFNIIGNEAALERQAKLIDENKESLEEFLRTLKEAGTDVPKRFFDELGRFDASKFVKEIETFGKPLNQLTAQAKSYKQQILENLQAEKESIESKRKLAKEALELAQSNKKAAESQMEAAKQAERDAMSMEEQAQAYVKIKRAKEELARTTEELAKAEKDYADINSSATDEKRIERAKELVKQYNEQAEALRKLGAAVKDIELDEIKDFDKSLGTNLKDILEIDKDVPKKFKDFAEDIKAMFTELGDLDFGNAGDILKDIGKGIFDALPADIKFATGTVTALTTAVYKLYEAGKQQFFEGLTNIGSKLQPVLELVRDFGQEVVSAFENITDTDIDLSSLMELGPNFEYNMQKVGAIAGSNKQQLEELTKTAERLGGTTQYTASDVAEAFQYMAKHTWSVMEKSIA